MLEEPPEDEPLEEEPLEEPPDAVEPDAALEVDVLVAGFVSVELLLDDELSLELSLFFAPPPLLL